MSADVDAGTLSELRRLVRDVERLQQRVDRLEVGIIGLVATPPAEPDR